MTDVYDITNLTKHCILHGCLALSPVGIRLPASGTFRIEQFCQDILGLILRCVSLSNNYFSTSLPASVFVYEYGYT